MKSKDFILLVCILCIFIANNFAQTIADDYFAIGLQYLEQQKFSEAVEYFEKAIKEYEKSGVESERYAYSLLS
ncbi:MAG: tetratricopeptide repeat protein, partial [Endomicrobia bacterium]|nr:tetratricopeptide repeat protein [Endomicrobiia bacterium]